MIKKFSEMRDGSAGADAAGNVGTQQCTVGKLTNSGPPPHIRRKAEVHLKETGTHNTKCEATLTSTFPAAIKNPTRYSEQKTIVHTEQKRMYRTWLRRPVPE